MGLILWRNKYYDELKNKRSSFVLYSHRGNTTDITMDNSLEGIKAVEKRLYIDGYELDFRLTKDGYLIATHDKNTKHISEDHCAKNISDMTLKEIQDKAMSDIHYYYKGLIARNFIDLPDKKRIIDIYTKKLDTKAIIPTAESIFEYLVNNNVSKKVLVELKENTNECADELSNIINTYKSRLDITAHGYDVPLMLKIKEQTGVPTGVLVKHDQTGIISKITKHPDRLTDEYIKTMPFDFWSIMWCYVTAHEVESLIRNNKGLNFWTIDSALHLKRALDIINKVEKSYGPLSQKYGIITNIPDIINEYTSEKGKEKQKTK